MTDPTAGPAADDVSPPHRRGPDWLRRLLAPFVAVFVVLAKFKALLLVLLHLSFFTSVATFALSLWFYVIAFGWPFAIVLLIVLVTHEFGHYAAFRAFGLPARLPNFVPFLGAFTTGAVPDDLEQDAYIALAGPLVGLGLSAACAAIGANATDPGWMTVAYFSAFLNLVNLIPVVPFDGGRVVRGIFPPAEDPRAADHDRAARIRVAAAYVGTAAALLWIAWQTHGAIAVGKPH